MMKKHQDSQKRIYPLASLGTCFEDAVYFVTCKTEGAQSP